jgi:hypothetical protein
MIEEAMSTTPIVFILIILLFGFDSTGQGAFRTEDRPRNLKFSKISIFEGLRKRKKINTSDDQNHYKHSNRRTHELTHRQTQSARLL